MPAVDAPEIAAPVGRFGPIMGAKYNSPVSPKKKSSAYVKYVKDPTDHSKQLLELVVWFLLTCLPVPVYDLSDHTFDPNTDFLNVADTRREIPNAEASLTEPIVVAFYITKWNRTYMNVLETYADLSMQWVGVLLKPAM